MKAKASFSTTSCNMCTCTSAGCIHF